MVYLSRYIHGVIKKNLIMLDQVCIGVNEAFKWIIEK